MTTLTVEQNNNVLVVDSRLVAENLGIGHKNLLATIDKYSQRIESAFGKIAFETRKSQRGKAIRFAWLTEDQATFLMTLSRNTERVVQCKQKLVSAFSKAKKILVETIPAQTQELESLRLQNQNLQLQLQLAQTQERLLTSCQTLALINPALPALVMGKTDTLPPEKVVVEKTVLVDSRSKKPVAIHEGISKTKLSKRYGMRKPQDLVNWLKSLGKEDVLESGLIAAPCQYVRWEKVQELDRLWSSSRGVRQKLLGE